MKKKIMAMCLVIAMAATAVIGGTLAYFTDTDEDTNVFTFGNVSIFQNEQQRKLGENEVENADNYRQHPELVLKDDDNFEDFADNKNVYPAILDKLTPKESITVNGHTFDIRKLDGNYMDKIVSVTNDGTEDAYIRTIFAIPSMNGWDDGVDATNNPLHWNYTDASDFNSIGWDWDKDSDVENGGQLCYVEEVKIDGVEYDIYVATHNTAVAKNTTTAPSMVGFYLDNDVNYGVVGKDEAGNDKMGYFQIPTDNKTGEPIDVMRDLSEYIKIVDGKATLNILVATQACQTEGFANAWEALDEAFGEITADNLPWEVDAPVAP